MSDALQAEIDALHDKMLRKELWVVMTRRVAPHEEVRRHLKAHLAYQVELEKSGHLFGAGPATVPGETHPAFGLILYRAKDEVEARALADADPMHASGVRTYELYRWSMNEGRITVTLDYSDRTFRLE
jgi:uncharacterized protein